MTHSPKAPTSIFWITAFFIAISTKLFALQTVSAQTHNQIDRRAVVYIEVQCENQETGAISTQKGSGFIIQSAGYVLTAHHVVVCDGQGDNIRRTGPIIGRIGSTFEPDRQLGLIKSDKQSDLAVLNILGLQATYLALPICSLPRPTSQSEFWAAGFPGGEDIQFVQGIIGHTNARAGGWAVASPFTHGMSGGPILQNGQAIGVIRGGHGNVTALRQISPIFRGRSMIEDATGMVLSSCAEPPADPDLALIEAFIRGPYFHSTSNISHELGSYFAPTIGYFRTANNPGKSISSRTFLRRRNRRIAGYCFVEHTIVPGSLHISAVDKPQRRYFASFQAESAIRQKCSERITRGRWQTEFNISIRNDKVLVTEIGGGRVGN